MTPRGSAAIAVEGTAREFFTNLFTGVLEGDLLSLAVVGIVALLILRFVAARWVFNLAKQVVVFGGLGFAVWWIHGEVGERYGAGAGDVVLYVGGGIVLLLFFLMLYFFFLRRSRIKRGIVPADAQEFERVGDDVVVRRSSQTRVGSGPLERQGLPVHRQSGGAEAHVQPAKGAAADDSHSKLEDVLRKMNVLGASRDQNLLTVMVLILVAEFGVFTSRTIAAPNAQVGMVLFAAFAVGAVVFVRTSYKSYMRGVYHFVFATIFAVSLSLLMLVYWQQTWCDTSVITANATAASECAGTARPIDWGTALNPQFYFASDGLIAAITGVAFSTLLTKGGG